MAGSELVQSLARGLDILSLVGAAEDGLRLAEVAAGLGLKLTTAHNLVRTLIDRRYLLKGADARLRLGPAVAHLHQQQSDRRLLQRVAAAMQALAARFGRMTLTYAEVVGSEIAFTLRLSPDRPAVLERPVGQTFHPYANASGLACLAFAPEELSLPIRARYPFCEFGAYLWGTPEQFATALEQMRSQGHAVLPFEGQETFRFAVPVYGPKRLFCGALGSSSPLREASDPARREELVAALKQRIKGLDL